MFMDLCTEKNNMFFFCNVFKDYEKKNQQQPHKQHRWLWWRWWWLIYKSSQIVNVKVKNLGISLVYFVYKLQPNKATATQYKQPKSNIFESFHESITN